MDETKLEKLQEVEYTVDGKRITEKEFLELQSKPNIRLVKENGNSYRTLQRMNG